jgi:hypothetical protein
LINGFSEDNLNSKFYLLISHFEFLKIVKINDEGAPFSCLFISMELDPSLISIKSVEIEASSRLKRLAL